jgi:hypothetical protein
MPKRKEPINPFYVLCGIAGFVFAITACSYGYLMLQSNRGVQFTDESQPQHPLMHLLELHGTMVLTIEVASLAIVSLAAIMLDHFRGKRSIKLKAAESAERKTEQSSESS